MEGFTIKCNKCNREANYKNYYDYTCNRDYEIDCDANYDGDITIICECGNKIRY
jgi:hypothetical protein